MLDVAVIGAGPAGSHCAYLLSKQGHRVLVLEKKPRAGMKQSCTGIIGRECLQLLSHRTIDVVGKFSSAIFFSPSGKSLRVEKTIPQAYAVDREIFDNQLVRSAREAGAEYSFNTPVERIEIAPEKARLVVEKEGGESRLDARAVVIACGFGSRLPEMVGLGQIRTFALGCQTEISACNLSEVEVYFGRNIAPGFFAWLVPLCDGRARIGLLSKSNSTSLIHNFWNTIRSRSRLSSTPGKIYYDTVPIKPLSRTYAERVVVVGDAAGQVKPTTCGGIYYSLICATEAANCINEAIEKDDFSAKQMSKYQKEWQKKLKTELKAGYMARRIFQKLTDRQIDQIFDIVLSNGIREALLSAEDFSFDWHGRLILKALKYQVLQNPLKLLGFRGTEPL
jgi:geranylgeranyl reductase family protein